MRQRVKAVVSALPCLFIRKLLKRSHLSLQDVEGITAGFFLILKPLAVQRTAARCLNTEHKGKSGSKKNTSSGIPEKVFVENCSFSSACAEKPGDCYLIPQDRFDKKHTAVRRLFPEQYFAGALRDDSGFQNLSVECQQFDTAGFT